MLCVSGFVVRTFRAIVVAHAHSVAFCFRFPESWFAALLVARCLFSICGCQCFSAFPLYIALWCFVAPLFLEVIGRLVFRILGFTFARLSLVFALGAIVSVPVLLAFGTRICGISGLCVAILG